VRVGLLVSQKALRGLDLQAFELSDEYLHAKMDHCAHLEELLLHDTRGCTADGVSGLVAAGPRIHRVALWQIEPTTFNKAAGFVAVQSTHVALHGRMRGR
jgi:hypothetical protein